MNDIRVFLRFQQNPSAEVCKMSKSKLPVKIPRLSPPVKFFAFFAFGLTGRRVTHGVRTDQPAQKASIVG